MTSTLVVLSFVLLSPAGSTTPARYAVVVSAPVAINAIEATVVLSSGARAQDISSAGSAVSYFIQAPEQDGSEISFAGVMPAGFAGEQELFEFSLPASAAGTLLYKDARSFLNGPDAREAPMQTKTLSLSPEAREGAPWLYILVVIALILLGWLIARHIRLRFS